MAKRIKRSGILLSLQLCHRMYKSILRHNFHPRFRLQCIPYSITKLDKIRRDVINMRSHRNYYLTQTTPRKAHA
ncbi:hypothetical protein MNBD_ALPHA05-1101 [hydrothermal vent metagenome]|uniref:Uncharacterized protein n=1 Tax=hydrothermal vent metagenome TaxID=652676 RepID=A0A3B0S9T6_9ZZZZ